MQYIFTDLPKYIKINSRQEFQNAIIEPGHVLLFSQDGQSLTAKHSDGSFVTLVTQDLDVYVVQSNSGVLYARKLKFNGAQVSDSQTVELLSDSSVLIFNTGHPEPQYGGGSAPSTSMDFYKCTYVNSDSWGGRKAVLNQGVYSFQSDSTQGLIYGAVKPVIGNAYNQGALIRAILYLGGSPLLDQYTLYLAQASKGMNQLVSNTSLTNSGGTVITAGAFDFAEQQAVLDFPISSASKWLLGDFTIQVVATACAPSFYYPSLISTGDAWQNNAVMLRFGNQSFQSSVGFFWTGVGDPVTYGGSLEYDNSTFHHMAICRSGSYVDIYIDGQKVTQYPEYCDTQWNVASDGLIRLGALDIETAKYVGKIRWARISNTARYTSNFDASQLITLN